MINYKTMNKIMEKRMYFFVPYNISPIQQAIQAGHASLEYARKYGDTELFKDFVDNHKTWIILNGGTTNSRGKPNANYRTDTEPYIGSLNNIAHQLTMNNIDYTLFNEPDLNDSLTAVCFITDERVFNKKDYVDFVNFLLKEITDEEKVSFILINSNNINILKETFPIEYNDWINIIGGDKNIFLRELLKGKKLA